MLAAEGLSFLLKSKSQSSYLSGIQVAQMAPPVSHLLFVDDNLLFFKESRDGEDDFSSLLNNYCQGSGQRINLPMSSAFFSKGCPESVRNEVKLA